MVAMMKSIFEALKMHVCGETGSSEKPILKGSYHPANLLSRPPPHTSRPLKATQTRVVTVYPQTTFLSFFALSTNFVYIKRQMNREVKLKSPLLGIGKVINWSLWTKNKKNWPTVKKSGGVERERERERERKIGTEEEKKRGTEEERKRREKKGGRERKKEKKRQRKRRKERSKKRERNRERERE